MLGVGRAGPLGSDAGPQQAGEGRTGERIAAMLLMSVEGLGPATFYRLLACHGSAESVLQLAASPAGRRRLEQTVRRDGSERPAPEGPRRVVEDVAESAARAQVILERLEAAGITWLSLDDPAYPARLRLLELPPPILFVQGDPAALAARSAIAVVGTRRPSDAGRRIAARIADALARRGAAVVSGLAIGIDGAAHSAVVEAGGRTVAVLGCGHERIYPWVHRGLAHRIVAGGGAVVSELPPGANPNRGTFPRRNRVISGLADATIVVEAAARSGALITAGWAIMQGRGCFVVPGSIDAPASAGCLALLREYPTEARIVAGIPELIEDLELADEAPAADEPASGRPASTLAGASPGALLAGLGATEASVARALAGRSATVDDLAWRSGLPVATLLGALTILELRGFVTAGAGRYRLAGGLAALDPSERATTSPAVASARQPVLP
jgi:DNA processing protein